MTQHLTADALRKDFLAVFGQEADQTFFSPGLRVIPGDRNHT